MVTSFILTGSGSIFETLRLGKPLIVVVNEDLMDNHQSELAEELADRKHLFCARPQTLQETVESMDLNNLLPYMPGDANQVVSLINKFLGFPVDWLSPSLLTHHENRGILCASDLVRKCWENVSSKLRALDCALLSFDHDKLKWTGQRAMLIWNGQYGGWINWP